MLALGGCRTISFSPPRIKSTLPISKIWVAGRVAGKGKPRLLIPASGGSPLPAPRGFAHQGTAGYPVIIQSDDEL